MLIEQLQFSEIGEYQPTFDKNCGTSRLTTTPMKSQLLKWVGNKQKFAPEIISYFPASFGTYFEPFLGAGGVIGVLAPKKAIAGDTFKPLVEIWQALHNAPDMLKQWYRERHDRIKLEGKEAAYEAVKASYNASPNGADLLFLCRVCYGGVVRFRKADGYMSTPCGPHKPMDPIDFARRVDAWAKRTAGTVFHHADYSELMAMAKPGDIIYCDPPYADSQAILYGAQAFSLPNLIKVIGECKERGVKVALSIDGKKKSGSKVIDLPIPEGLFEREVFVELGGSMLKRFQLDGLDTADHQVHDRLLLTY